MARTASSPQQREAKISKNRALAEAAYGGFALKVQPLPAGWYRVTPAHTTRPGAARCGLEVGPAGAEIDRRPCRATLAGSPVDPSVSAPIRRPTMQPPSRILWR